MNLTFLWSSSSPCSSLQSSLTTSFVCRTVVSCLGARLFPLPSQMVGQALGREEQSCLSLNTSLFVRLLLALLLVPMENHRLCTVKYSKRSSFWSSYLPLSFSYLQSYPSEEMRHGLPACGYFDTVHILTVE